MQMDIQSQGFVLTDGINDYVTQRLAFGLSHGDEAISRVNVRLSDINGPRGGGAGRAGRTMARRLSRQRQFWRSLPAAYPTVKEPSR